MLTPEDVQNKVFRPTRFRPGYGEDDVDTFLDEVEASLTRLLRENDELRRELGDPRRPGGRGPGLPGWASEGSQSPYGGFDDVHRQMTEGAQGRDTPVSSPRPRRGSPVLTPREVRGKVFKLVKFRTGYNQEEVDAFLREVEASLTQLIRENDELRRQLDDSRRY